MKEGSLSGRDRIKKQFSHFSVRTKLIVALLVVSLCSMLASTYICSKTGEALLSEKVFNQLTTLRGSTAQQLERYFKFIVDHTQTLSDDEMFVSAMKETKQAFDQLATVNVPKEYDEKLLQFYRNEFVPRLTQGLGATPVAETFLPKTPAARYLQYHYIANNLYPIGEKYKLADPKDGSAYSRINAKYTDKFLNIAQRFGYDDMYFIDLQGNVIFVLSNEPEFATNILTGPLADSNLTAAYRACRRSNSSTYVKVVDFQPYLMSYNAPTAFVASPIFDNAQMIGVLAFKLPTKPINQITNYGNKWKEQGLGNTAEVVLVGPDSLMRSNARLMVENPEKFLQVASANGVSEDIVKKIRYFKTTTLLLLARSKGIDQALRGKTLLFRGKDYRGIEVLGSTAPIQFAELQWVISAKIEVSEAFASIAQFQRQVFISAALIMVLVTLISTLISYLFVKPINQIIATTQQVEAGDENAIVKSGTRDEFNDLARAFNSMVYTLRSQIQERDHNLKESDTLIDKLMPLHIAGRLKAGEGMVADPAPNVTVLFSDIEYFTRLSQRMNNVQVVHLLDDLIDGFDDLVDKYGLEKIKSIGDGYMAVCGLSVPQIDSDRRTIDCALEMIAYVHRYSDQHGLNINLRVGINTGEVVAGTVGKSRFNYDVWGETVNNAHRLKSAAPAGSILVSSEIHERLADIYEFEPFRPIAEPGKEALEAWQLRSESRTVETQSSDRTRENGMSAPATSQPKMTRDSLNQTRRASTSENGTGKNTAQTRER
jgi:class 3 adenylate cyclase